MFEDQKYFELTENREGGGGGYKNENQNGCVDKRLGVDEGSQM